MRWDSQDFPFLTYAGEIVTAETERACGRVGGWKRLRTNTTSSVGTGKLRMANRGPSHLSDSALAYCLAGRETLSCSIANTPRTTRDGGVMRRPQDVPFSQLPTLSMKPANDGADVQGYWGIPGN
jgi:hypothetical protein